MKIEIPLQIPNLGNVFFHLIKDAFHSPSQKVRGFGPTQPLFLFNGDALGEISWLIDVASAKVCDIIGQELKGNGREQGG